MRAEKRVEYRASAPYETLNGVSDRTRNIWLVFHGMGYLSRYFLKYFSGLDPLTNYIIAPQAPAKYYLDDKFRNVGASWLTRVDTALETKNVLAYVDAVWEEEAHLAVGKRLIVMGYSQGVSIATRWVASRKIDCHELILHSGAIPGELTARDFNHISNGCVVTYLYGDKDQYINEARLTEQELKARDLFSHRLQTAVFKGVHEVNIDFLREVSVR